MCIRTHGTKADATTATAFGPNGSSLSLNESPCRTPPEGSTLVSSLDRGLLSAEFTDFELIGKGGFGRVVKAWHIPTQQWHALKLIPMQLQSSETVDSNHSSWSGPEVFERLLGIRSSKVIRYFRRWAELPEDLPESCYARPATPSTCSLLENLPASPNSMSQLWLSENVDSTCGFEWEEAEQPLAVQAVKDQDVSGWYPKKSYDVMLVIQMEYCDAITLSDWIAQPSLRPKLARGGLDTALELFSQLMSGLAEIHDAGIVHRDIKPANILVCKSTGQIKIFDFGLAKMREKDVHHVASRSPPPSGGRVSRTALGTPGYAPPEHCCVSSSIKLTPKNVPGQANKIKPETVRFVIPPACSCADIFPAGIVLVELLMAGVAGKSPAWGTAMERVNILGALREDRDAALPRKLQRDGGVGAWLRQLVFRMVSWDAEGRPSAQEVLDELEANYWAASRHNPYLGTHHRRSPQFAAMLAHLSAAHNPYIGFFLDHRPGTPSSCH